MKPLLYLIILLFQSSLWAVAQINLKGIITNDGCNNGLKHKDCKVFPNVRVSVGSMSDVTDVNGRFAINLPLQYTPGSEVIAHVEVPGHSIHMPLYGKFNLPNTLLDDVFEQQIILLPKGSLKHFTNTVIIAFINNISKREIEKLKAEKERAFNDYGHYFKEFADYHGFTAMRVKELIDQWVETDTVKNAINDWMLQGARDYYLRNFIQSSVYYEKAARLKGEVVEEQLKEADNLLKKNAAGIGVVCYAFFLAGNSASEAYDFKRAIRMYTMADSVITLPDSLQSIYGSYKEEKCEVGIALATALCDEGIRTESGEGIKLLTQAVATCHTVLEYYSRKDYPDDWARAQHILGNIYKELGSRMIGSKGAALLTQSEAVFRSVLEIRTRIRNPEAWATTQNNLGTTFYEKGIRIEGNRGAALLVQSLVAFRAAMEVYTLKKQPVQWAIIQFNIGNVFRVQGLRMANHEGDTLLARSVATYHAALEIFTKKDDPERWASIQSNLALTLKEQGKRFPKGERGILLAKSVNACRAALEIVTRESLPQQWVLTHINLSVALLELADLMDGNEKRRLLEQSADACRAALEMVSRENSPQYWAQAQVHLGLAHNGLALLMKDAKVVIDLLKQAVNNYQAGLQILTKEDLPQLWAFAQTNLASILYELGTRTARNEGDTLIEQAALACRGALEIYTKKDQPRQWAMLLNNLAVILCEQGSRRIGDESITLLQKSVAVCYEALEVQTRKHLPIEWGLTQKNLGKALLELAARISDSSFAKTLLTKSADSYCAALEVYTKQDMAREWALMQHEMGAALMGKALLTRDSESIYLWAQSAAAFHLALEVYTRKDLPEQWAGMHNNLAYVLKEQGIRTGGTEGDVLLERSVIACHAALEIFTKKDFPKGWATAQHNLGLTFKEQGIRMDGDKGRALLAQAEQAYLRALETVTKNEEVGLWVMIYVNLGTLHEHTRQWTKAKQCYEKLRELFPEEAATKIKEIEEQIKQQ
ncbi:hypothetical protein HB364_17405 [Pseudoflavitalea sp. X16]|uniref:hypothetical protein n=1 Tax=Paraflavitalea devenefica TaxID=2716334 RepID=UPI00141ECEA9|nr:hypothetical protein [Paraflavitalea devenefica]NII26871.1 hypothetical protein [Paraflavitalea devenefica]